MTDGKRLKENGYKNILKRISAFGGVQIFNILIALIRGKFVALFLGPAGMGVSSLYTSSTNTIQQFAGLGLNLAFVKEVAAAKDDAIKMQQIVAIALRLILTTSLLGALTCFFLSPLLSLWTFGSYDYTWGFIFLSTSVALSIAAASYLALLQGIGAVKQLAKASLIGGIVGLCLGVPLYYFWGVKGIVPSIIILSTSSFLFYYITFSRSGYAKASKFNWREHRPIIKRLLSIGVVLMSGSLIGTFTGYLINTFVREFGSVADVGLFQAANSLTNQYVGVIFSALALDYFPRLSASIENHNLFNEIINRQVKIVSLIVTPLVIVLFVSAPLVIKLLLSESFEPILPLLRWLGLGVLIEAIAFPLGYVFIAKNNNRIYFIVQVVIGNILWICCSVLFYYLYQLIGLGISLVVRTIIAEPIGFIFLNHYYKVTLSKDTIIDILTTLGFGIAAFLVTTYEFFPLISGICLLISSITFSAIKLRKRLKE